MKRNYSPFKGPFLDSYSIGFRLYQPGAINWRHRTIAGVSWNGEEQEAFFFNPDGLVLPLKPNPWELPELLRKNAVRREFSSIHGTGHFAMKEGRRTALKSLGYDRLGHVLAGRSIGRLCERSGGVATASPSRILPRKRPLANACTVKCVDLGSDQLCG